MSFLNNEAKNKDKIIRIQKCVYCKQKVNTCQEIPKCSRKKCKKERMNRVK